MPVTGRVNQLKPSIVRTPPQLPVPLYAGSLSCSLSFEGHPSANISYEGILERDISRYETAYIPNQTTLAIEGIQFVVSSYGYERERHPHRQQPFNTYKVAIALKSLYEQRVSNPIKVFKVVNRLATSITLAQLCAAASVPYVGPSINLAIPKNADANLTMAVQEAVNAHHRINGCYVSYVNGVTLLNFDSGRASWNFTTSEILTDGQNTRSAWNAYKDTELTWGNSQDNPTSTTPTKGVQFVQKEPKIEEIIEADNQYDSPPPGTYILKDLSSTCDESSPTTTYKKTRTIDGTPDREEVRIYKFCYTATDIWDASQQMLFGANPAAFWQPVETQVTEHIYEALPAITLTIRAKDPNPMYAKDSLGGYVTLVVHPDYTNLINASPVGGTITFQSSAKYLTQVITTTTKQIRLAKESPDGGGSIGYASLDQENPYYSLVFYKQVVGQQKQTYLLKSVRNQFGSDVGSPFSVEWKKYDELENRIKKIVSNANITSTGLVGILTPDPNYKEPMYIKTESKTVNTFLWAPNPESAPPDDYKAPLTTGEESYYQVDRTIVAANKYRERTTENSFQESGFLTGAERVSFKEVIGRPPEASTRDTQWEKKDKDTSKTYQVSNATTGKTKKYLLTSDDLSEFTQQGGSVSYAQAESLNQALAAATLDLRIKDLQACQSARKIAWYYPQIRDGDVVAVGSDRFFRYGQWRVMGATLQLTYFGSNNQFGLAPACICEGTALTLGCDRDRSVTYTEENIADTSGAGTSGDPKLETTGGSSSNTLGLILIDAPSRRHF